MIQLERNTSKHTLKNLQDHKIFPIDIATINDNLPCTLNHSRFLCSSADIHIHCKVDLHDSPIHSNIKEKFDALWDEYTDPFCQHIQVT